MIVWMAMAGSYAQTARILTISACSKMINLMDMGKCSMKICPFTLVIGWMARGMDKERLRTRKERSLKVIG